jgi:DNA/RNA-binding domain of Phe-tRNA-synthetase-like protein
MSNKIINPHLEIQISPEFLKTYSKASVGVLVLENINKISKSPDLDSIIGGIVSDLRKQFLDRQLLKMDPVIEAYSKYYKKFKKSYHVLGQLESAIFENRPLPSGSALIATMFAAELKNILLTAIHDLDAIHLPVEIGISTGDEIYTTLRGTEQRLKPWDMTMRDQIGVISSVIYGPDQRTRVTPSTSKVIFVVYAPEGIERQSINKHFEDIKQLIWSFSPQFKSLLQEIFPAGLKR